MGKPQRQLRSVQLGCLLLVGAYIGLAYWRVHGNPETSSSVGFGQGIIILLALWSAAWGFTMQRQLQRRRRASTSKSRPFTRWRAGHIVRLWSATTVGIWALVLQQLHGPLWIANVLFGLAILLLLIWKPGIAPAPDEVTPAQ
jgi:hypothetical protein